MSDDTDPVPEQPTGSDAAFHGPDWHETDSRADDATPRRGRRVRISRRRKQKLRRRRRIGAVMIIGGAVIVLAGVYLVVTALLARRELTQVRADVARMRSAISSGDLAVARKAAADLAAHAGRADTFTSGPVWFLAAGIPGGGEPLRTVRGITATVDSLASSALPDLVNASRSIDPSRLRRPDGSIDLAPIEAVAPKLAHAAVAVDRANRELADLPASTWLGSVDQARRDAQAQFGALGSTVRTANIAARVAPAMLGRDGPRLYFVSFQTEAELRGTGGLPGAFAIMRADHGKISFARFENDSALNGVSSGLNLGAEYNALYASAGATSVYLDSNASPHFPYAARIWTAMWEKKTGQHLDGAFGLDPTALSYFLQVTGPARLPDGTSVSAEDVVRLTQQTVYAKFPSAKQDARKAFQLQLAKTVSRQLIEHTGSATALVKAAGRAAGQRRLMAWSSDPAVQRLLQDTPLGGAVARTTRPFIGVSVYNTAINKVDYYTGVNVDWRRQGCGTRREVTVTLRVTNSAPARLPEYVLGATGTRGYPQKPGDNRVLLRYYATQGAQITTVQVDGKVGTRGLDTELGHPVYTFPVDMPRGKTRTIVVHLVEPASTGKPVIMPQPLVRPMTVSVRDAHCS